MKRLLNRGVIRGISIMPDLDIGSHWERRNPGYPQGQPRSHDTRTVEMRPTKYLLAAALALCAGAGTAHAKTFHYACKSGEDRYALTVNTDRGT
jgi:hypothetical protein